MQRRGSLNRGNCRSIFNRHSNCAADYRERVTLMGGRTMNERTYARAGPFGRHISKRTGDAHRYLIICVLSAGGLSEQAEPVF